MFINKQIDFKKEAIDLIHKLYSDKNIDQELLGEIEEYGLDGNEVKKLLNNYFKLKSSFKNEVSVPDKLIPYFIVKSNTIPVLNRLYVKYINSEKLDHKIFINRFFETDLAFKEDYSETLDFNDILNIINGLDMDDKDKLTLISLYTGGEELFLEIMECVEKSAVIYQKYYHFVEEEVMEFYNIIQDTDTLPTLLNDFFKGEGIYQNSTTEINISISDYSYIFHKTMDNKRYIYVGYLVFKFTNLIKNKNNDEEEALNVIKSLSDSTRYKILKILSLKQTYGSDIASQLGLSAATINHHLNILVNNYLLKMVIDPNDNKKIYYEINKTRLNQVLNTIRSNLL